MVVNCGSSYRGRIKRDRLFGHMDSIGIFRDPKEGFIPKKYNPYRHTYDSGIGMPLCFIDNYNSANMSTCNHEDGRLSGNT